MSQFWRNKSTPKSILERIQVQEYGTTRQMQRTGVTRWKSQLLVSDALLRTQTAMQKAVVDDVFKNEVLKDKDAKARKAAAEASALVKNDALW